MAVLLHYTVGWLILKTLRGIREDSIVRHMGRRRQRENYVTSRDGSLATVLAQAGETMRGMERTGCHRDEMGIRGWRSDRRAKCVNDGD